VLTQAHFEAALEEVSPEDADPDDEDDSL